MTRYRKEEIRKRAKDILRECDIKNAPVDPVHIANCLGIRVIPAVFKEDWISGGIRKQGDSTAIYVNTEEPLNRIRFTIAHELGHYNMHMDEIGDQGILESVDMYRSPDSDKDKEAEANEFAAAILMPEDELKKCWLKYHSVDLLADLFQVSRQAMKIRLSKLGLC